MDIQVAQWLTAVGIIEACAICVAFYLVISGRARSPWIKAGLILMAFGLCVQLVRSTNYLHFGVYPVDKYFPLWITKDIGASLLIFAMLFRR